MRRAWCLMMMMIIMLLMCLCLTAHSTEYDYDTIIVGMGAAGSAASARLAAASSASAGGREYRILGIDAMNRLGGRICTQPLGDGLVEMGAEWMHGTHPSMVYDTAVAHNISVLEQTFEMAVYTSTRGPVSDVTKELVDVASEYAFSHDGLPGVSIADYTANKLSEYVKSKHPELSNSSAVADVLRHVSQMVGGYEAAEWHLVTSHSTYSDLNGNQHASWGRAGYAAYIDILLNKYNNGPGYPNLDIRLDTEVLNITYDNDDQHGVTVTTTNGTYTANNVIVTVSLGVLKQRHLTMFNPPLPANKVAAIEAIPMGLLGKIQLVYHTPWWTNVFNKNMSIGFLWTQDEIASLPSSRQWIASIVGVTAPLGADNVITAWTYSHTAHMIPGISEDEVRGGVTQLMKKFLKSDAPEPKQILRSDWQHNPYTLGSYTYDGLSVTANMRRTLAEPLADSSGTPRVYLAGEATSEKWYSTVHGASNTGWEQAGRIINDYNR